MKTKTVAIVGRPNVGKSTLVNRIIGERRSIVDDLPGVTRDRIYFDAIWQHKPFIIIDTGGIITNDDDEFVKNIFSQAKLAVDEADLILFVVDAKEGLNPYDNDIADILRQSKKEVVVVANKVDSPDEITMYSEFYALGFDEVMPISALHGSGGVGDLLDRVTKDIETKKEEEIEGAIKIAIAGKYTGLSDAYISVVEALKHAGYAHHAKIDIKWINSEECIDQKKTKEILSDVDGLVVPGGFGVRGIEGKLNAIRYARENNLPFLGLCLGMQCAVIEYARHVVGLKDANSMEFNEGTPYPVIDIMLEQKNIENMGGTMRLGKYDCVLKKGTKAYDAYGKVKTISERHRHRYEVNNEYKEQIEKAGLVFSGMSPDGQLCEIVEYPKNDWFVACQFHPEFKSRPEHPHPLFAGLINAINKRLSK